MTREELIKALSDAKQNNLSIGECWNLMDAAADMLEADGVPVGIPADILDAAKSMQSNDYRGPLAWARKVIDFVADYTVPQPAIQERKPLTDENALNCLDDAGINMRSDVTCEYELRIFRAAEAAHGITENKP